MWASSPLQLSPPVSRPSSAKPPLLRHRIAALAQTREDNYRLSSLDLAFGSALNSRETRPLHRDAKQPPSPPQKEESEEEEEQKQRKPLTGADVLIALQKATAAKTNRKKQKRGYSTAAASVVSEGGNRGGRKIGRTPDFANVRPLVIKPEWSDRLKELETRLESLLAG